MQAVPGGVLHGFYANKRDGSLHRGIDTKSCLHLLVAVTEEADEAFLCDSAEDTGVVTCFHDACVLSAVT